MDPLGRFQDKLDTILSIDSNNGLRQCTKETLAESDIVQIGNLLRHGANKIEWAKRPRLFAILYIIGCMKDGSTMDEFVRLGYKDTALPFADPLPNLLKSHKARFKENQKRILTGVGDLENGRGHQYFEDGDKYYSEGRQLGVGTYAYVYEVFSQQSFENFARKLFNKPRRPDEALRVSKAVADEVEHLKDLSHRHLVKFIGSYTDMKYIAILMQPVARCNLNEFLNQSPLPPADQSRLPCYFGCLANTLKYLHAPPRRIKHKDLKPGNILISSEGRVLITDFGSATSFRETGHSTTMGSEFTFTADYAPPEVVELKPRNTKADVYSLGAVFFEMWTVLKGESITNMKSYFSNNGSRGGNIRTNPVAVSEWSKQLTAIPGHPSMNEPIAYIRRMIQDDSHDRPDMDEIVLETVGFGQTSRFCCQECMSEYTDEGIFRRFYASHLNPTIPRSNSAIPEKTSQSKVADSTSVVARPISEIGNPASTAQPWQPNAAFDSTQPPPSGSQLAPTRLETLPTTNDVGTSLIMAGSSTVASQLKSTSPRERPPGVFHDNPEWPIRMTRPEPWPTAAPSFATPTPTRTRKSAAIVIEKPNGEYVQHARPTPTRTRKSAAIVIKKPNGEYVQHGTFAAPALSVPGNNAGIHPIVPSAPEPPPEPAGPRQIRASSSGSTSTADDEARKLEVMTAVQEPAQSIATNLATQADEDVDLATAARMKPHGSTLKPVGETEIPRVDSAGDTTVISAFQGFAAQQRRNIEAVRAARARNDKDVRLADLKKFADSFKLISPLPSDLVTVMAKDPVKQREILQRAKRNAEVKRPGDMLRIAISPNNTTTHTEKSADFFKFMNPVQTDHMISRPKDPTRQKFEERAKRNVEAARVDYLHRNSAPIANARRNTAIHTKDQRFSPVEKQAEASTSQEPLPYITEVLDRAWVMPEQFKWTITEMNNLIRLKRSLSPKDFKPALVTEFPDRSGSNVKKFWTAFCQMNNLRTAA